MWCAREQVEVPDSELTMDPKYGWIHWDTSLKTWHTIGNTELGAPRTAPGRRIVAPARAMVPEVDPE